MTTTLDLDKAEGAKEENFDADRSDARDEADFHEQSIGRDEQEEAYGIVAETVRNNSIR